MEIEVNMDVFDIVYLVSICAYMAMIHVMLANRRVIETRQSKASTPLAARRIQPQRPVQSLHIRITPAVRANTVSTISSICAEIITTTSKIHESLAEDRRYPRRPP